MECADDHWRTPNLRGLPVGVLPTGTPGETQALLGAARDVGGGSATIAVLEPSAHEACLKFGAWDKNQMASETSFTVAWEAAYPLRRSLGKND